MNSIQKPYNNKYYKILPHKKFSLGKELMVNLFSLTPIFSDYYFQLLKSIHSLPHGAKVLDIGTAQGSTLNFIHNVRTDLKLYGVDMSNVKDMLPPYVTFIKANIIKDKIPEDNFDFIISRHLIEHLNISDVETFFNRCHSLLKESGKCFILCPTLSNQFYNDPTHIRPYNKESLRRLFLMSNFKSIKTFEGYEFNFFNKGMCLAYGVAER